MGKVPIVRGRIGGGVDGDTMPGPEWDNLGPSVGGHYPLPLYPGYIGFPSLEWMGRWIFQWKDKWGRH